MINAVHAVLYTKDADGARAFFRDVLGFPSVDAGHGWLIFALPPAELGIHPAEDEELKRKGVEFTQPVKDAGFGMLTSMRIPGGGELSLYQPKHASPLHLRAGANE